jgi:hypothetical protein
MPRRHPGGRIRALSSVRLPGRPQRPAFETHGPEEAPRLSVLVEVPILLHLGDPGPEIRHFCGLLGKTRYAEHRQHSERGGLHRNHSRATARATFIDVRMCPTLEALGSPADPRPAGPDGPSSWLRMTRASARASLSSLSPPVTESQRRPWILAGGTGARPRGARPRDLEKWKVTSRDPTALAAEVRRPRWNSSPPLGGSQARRCQSQGRAMGARAGVGARSAPRPHKRRAAGAPLFPGTGLGARIAKVKRDMSPVVQLPAVKRRISHRCDRCKTPLFRYSSLDAWWCSRCDSWAESTCGDAACGVCADRPARPSMMLRRALPSRSLSC